MAQWLKHGVLAAVLGVGSLSGLGAESAQACEPQYRWVKVTTYEPQTEKYVDTITKYDHCGRPYRVAVLREQTVIIPVSTWVKVRV